MNSLTPATVKMSTVQVLPRQAQPQQSQRIVDLFARSNPDERNQLATAAQMAACCATTGVSPMETAGVSSATLLKHSYIRPLPADESTHAILEVRLQDGRSPIPLILTTPEVIREAEEAYGDGRNPNYKFTRVEVGSAHIARCDVLAGNQSKTSSSTTSWYQTGHADPAWRLDPLLSGVYKNSGW